MRWDGDDVGDGDGEMTHFWPHHADHASGMFAGRIAGCPVAGFPANFAYYNHAPQVNTQTPN